MDKTIGARRRQLLAAVSVLGVSLGMAESAVAAQDDATTTTVTTSTTSTTSISSTQSSQKGQSSTKSWSQSSVKGQNSVKNQTGQHSQKLGPSSDQNTAKTQGPTRFDVMQEKSD